jgi:hypothetical protein
MKTPFVASIAAAAACLFAAAAAAAEQAPSAAPATATPASAVAPAPAEAPHEVLLDSSTASTPAESKAGEPAVRRTVIDDRSAHIEELRVRGQLQKVTVDPKGGAPAYEIIVIEGARDTSDGVSSTRGAAGKRVWNIFRF